MNSRVLVGEDPRTGIAIDLENDVVVMFPNRKPPPFSVVKGEVTFRNKKQQSNAALSTWRPVDELVALENAAERDSALPKGMVGRVAVDELTGDARAEAQKLHRPAVGVRFVDRSRVAELVTHYEFDSVEHELQWIRDAVDASRPIDRYEGRPVRISEELRTALIDGLSGKAELDSVRRSLEKAREERDQLANEVDEAKAALKQETNQFQEVERKSKQARQAEEQLQGRLSKLQQEIEETERTLSVKVDRREEIEEALQNLSSRYRGEQERLDADLADLRREHANYLEKVEEAKRQARLEHDAMDTRVKKLRALSPIEDEADALNRLGDAFADRVEFDALVAVHVALKHFPFLVLTGPSGSGKSSLLARYGEAFGIFTETIPVQPNWTSVADLHGYVFPLGTTRRFITTPFSKSLGMQVEGEEFLSLAILDEINLSHVEYYLADYLSAFEGDRAVDLAEPQELEDAEAPSWLARSNGRVVVPPSFLIAGTANEDHTTRAFSDKFRDRTAALELPANDTLEVGSIREEKDADPLGRVTPEVWQRWKRIPEARPGSRLKRAFKSADGIMKVLRDHGVDIGYRSYRDVERFMRSAEPLLALYYDDAIEAAERSGDLALDMRVMQKAVPLMEKRWGRGSEKFRQVVGDLERVIIKSRHPRLLERVEALQR